MTASPRTMKPPVHLDGMVLRARRQKLGRSQAHIAGLAGTSQQTVQRVEKGETKWPRSAESIAAVLESLEASADQRNAGPTVATQRQIDVEPDSDGNVVMQMAPGGVFDEPQVIEIRPENIDAVVAALLRAKAEMLS